MPRYLTLKDHFRETQLFTNRLLIALVITIILLGCLTARLIYLQVINHKHFITLSEDNRVDILPIAPTRGLIYDRNGLLIAENRPAFSLEVIPERVEDLDATIERLRGIIDIHETDIQRFNRLLKEKRRFESVPLRLRLSEEEVARFSINRHHFHGVDIEARLTRHYPFGPLAAHVVGYVGRINEQELQRLDASNYSATRYIGKLGVENFYEATLHGQVGFQQVEINAQGRILRVLERTPPVPGKNLYLHLDLRMQAAAAYALGEQRGAIVVIDPRTGALIAAASTPSYDPNLFVHGIEPKAYAALNNASSRPLFNRSLRGQYPPGSTIKPFIALAGLKFAVTTPERHTYCPGWFTLKGSEHKYRCWKRWGHGTVNLRRAIVESCDVYFYDLAYTLGIDRIHSFLQRFGFGIKTGIDLSGERAGLLPSSAWKRKTRNRPWYPGETLITGIGQGFFLTTPLQLAHATAILANRGRRFQPRAVYAIQTSGEALNVQAPIELAPVPIHNPNHWEQVIQAMIEVVHGLRGTARRIGKDAPVTIAGKTGTAQVFGLKPDQKYSKNEIPEHLRDHALFIAFAPAEEPQIAVAVVVENGGSGGAVAAPLARRVIDHFFQIDAAYSEML